MKRYIALLRGINIGGNNKIAMKDLQIVFEELGYENVKTFINSGNIAFSCNTKSESMIEKAINESIFNKFGLNISVFVIKQEYLCSLLNSAPSWWGNDDKAIYNNLVFVLHGADAKEIAEKVGEPTKDIDQIFIKDNVIFWSFDRKMYQKSNWWKKTSSAGISKYLTIRSSNTVKKITKL